MSQDYLARAVGVTQGAINHYERGLKVPSLPVAIQIAKILGITLDELVK